MTGQLYKQFAVTIAVSVAISGLVALTLSPALCALLLRPGHGRKNFFFRWFDKIFGWITASYTLGVRLAIRYVLASVLIFGILCFMMYRLSQTIPTGFLPDEDQGYIISTVLLPDGASLDRTDQLLRQVESFFLNHPAVRNVNTLGGLDILSGGSNSSNAATMFIQLKPFQEREDPSLSAQALVGAAFQEFASAKEGLVLSFNPPPIQGLGIRAGFQMELQARSGQTFAELAENGNQLITALSEHPILEGIRGTLRMQQPQLYVDLNREKAKMMGIQISEIFDALQAFFGSLYVNDFNKFGRIWRVQLQAEEEFRDTPEDINRIYVRNNQGEMAPLSGVVSSEFRVGPNLASRFNGFPSIQITGAPILGKSTGEAMQAVREVFDQVLPAGYGFEWSGASYQEVKAGNQAPIILMFGLIVVFLVLAAQYEQWSLPLAVLLIVPFAVLGALVAIMLRGFNQDIYFQIGLLTLVGLSAKNAILIVEFCVALRREGMPIVDAALEAARLRFRPIIMTSLAFILGVLPLAIAHGAGAAARHSIGTGVIGGMLAATFLAPLMVPLFFVIIQSATEYFLGSSVTEEKNIEEIELPV